MRLGIIGVGHLASALVKGVLRTGFLTAENIVLAPRGHSAQLRAQFGCTIAEDNAGLVNACDTVLLAVRPQDAVAAVSGLPWRSDQIVLSACAGVSIADLAPYVQAAQVVRIMPTIAAQFGESATLVYPALPQLAPLLAALGKSYELKSEDHFEVGSVSAAIFGWAQALIGASSDWSSDKGMDRAQARALIAQTFISAGTMVAKTDEPVSQLLDSLATPGGITEAGLKHLENTAAIEAWNGAADAALGKLEKRR
ncbi:MAG: NAD(P)-binding domain-containing protein [Rhizobiaceae bacterium]|nr:NAD(P)-binding domain-containing protein [Hyphomicrobiales bacterium]NRB31150.1 NAD(P)-binding domain-containing protein [Rhizobiaceae bacterium]